MDRKGTVLSWLRRFRLSLVPAGIAIAATTCGLAFAPFAGAQVNVTTQQNDIGRTGQNLKETTLNTSNVNPSQFGKLFSQPVAGAIQGQPLYLSDVVIGGVTHNVVFVATGADIVYALDASSNGGANAKPLWKASLLDAAHGAAAGAKPYAGVGVTSTPVIDTSSNTIYLVSESFENGAAIYKLHALDVITGKEKFGGPAVISASVPGSAVDAIGGQVNFTPLIEKQRAGLLLLNGIVYFGFSSYFEGQEAIWHGWIFGYAADDLAQTGVFCVTCNGYGGGVWMAGNGLAADQLDPVNHPYGRMFAPIGNGDFTASTPFSSGMDFGDSVVDFDLTNGVPSVTDFFTPYNQALLATQDHDQGSGGALILPTQTQGPYPNLLVQAGKSETLFLLDRDDLSGYNSSQNLVVQSIPNAVGTQGVWSSPAYWNGNVYFWGSYDKLKQFTLSNGQLSTSPILSSEQSNSFGETPAISANGNSNGIVWSIEADPVTAGAPAILLAHDASNVSTTLYSSTTNPARDTAGPASHFTVPTVANGIVYVPAIGELDFYGLINGAMTAAPTISPGSESFVGSPAVTITDSTPNAQIYYTTDGTAATASSTPYTGPITVSSSETINAVALAPGSTLSYQSWASYSMTQTALPSFSPAPLGYSSAQMVTINSATSGAAIYYTTDGTTPTTGSTPYTGPILVSSAETIKAIALAPGYSTSSVGTGVYTIGSSASVPVDYAAGFTSSNGLTLLGAATLTNNALQLSVAHGGTSSSAVWSTTPVNVQSFTTDFFFQDTPANANGFTFTLQNSSAGANAIGASGSGLGYQGIGSSVAIKFDLFDSVGEGYDSTGFYTNGAAPTLPAIDMTDSGVILSGGHVLDAHITYNGTTLTLTLIDTVTGVSFTTSKVINIPVIVGANTAYVGFTAGTSHGAATQSILDWTYCTAAISQAAAPSFAPGAGVYPSAQSVMLSDSTSGATIYYTTNGNVPTTSSTPYTSPIAVSANETLKAIAVASGHTNSAVTTAAYQIRTATPTIAPTAGTYTGPQTVTITDTTGGATIYYTTNGTVPTTSSAVYSAPFTVSASETVKAIAAASGYANSSVASTAFSIRAATPTFMPGAGTYSGAQSVTIGDATSGATIYYTTNGTVPTTSSTVYTTPITVSANETLKAIAAVSSDVNSTVGAAVYKIEP